jgi:hypothetical protein
MDDNVDVKFLRTNANGFKNAETDLLELGWKEKRFTRATNKDIKRAYFVYLVKEKAEELKRGLTPDEISKLEKAALELKNTKMYIKSRGASAVSMNNSEEYVEEEVFIPENERLEMVKKIRNAERPKSVSARAPRSASAANIKKVHNLLNKMRAPPKASFPNASLNLPNNSKDYEGNAIPLNNILRNFNKLNIRNRNTLKRKRGNSLSLSNRRVSRKRSRSMNAPRGMRRTRFIRKFKPRSRSRFNNLPSNTRRKIMKRQLTRKRN